MANRFNVGIGAKDNLSIALGTIETTLYEMTNAYNVLASQGQQTTPTTIVSIKMHMGMLFMKTKMLQAKRKQPFLKKMHTS